MPSRSRSRSMSRGRASKRFRSRSGSVGSGMYNAALRSRSSSRARPMRRAKMSLNVHRFSRWGTDLSNIQCSGTSIAGTMQFTMDQVINYSEFSSLFDQFKITKVVVQLQLITNPDSTRGLNAAAGNQPTNWFPKFWYIRDYDGGSADSLAEIKERQGVKCFVLRPNKIYRIGVSPKVAVQTYRTSTTTGYAPKALSLDFASGYDVSHYGLHYVVDALGQDPDDSFPFLIKREYKFYFTCKDVR